LELAAISAATLATIHLERGDAALAQGWLARAQDLVTPNGETPAYGYVLWLASRVAAFQGNLEGAQSMTERAYELGRRLGDCRVEALSLMYRGFYRLCRGETRAGLQDQDHAGALALSRQLDPMTGGTLYCNILWACRSFGDWARANQWTLGYRQLCIDLGVDFSGSCQLHRAEVLGVQGSLLDALAYVEDALVRLPDDAPWSLGDAHRVLGDIQSAIGNREEAFRAYDKSDALGWSPEPGRAMLLLETGQAEAAYSSLENSLLGQGWWTLQRQGVLLAHLALVAAQLGRHEKAESLIHELTKQSDRWPMASIRALTNEASAVVAKNQGDLTQSIRHLYLARQLWMSIDSKLNATRLRVQIATALMSINDVAGAMTEIRIARQAADELKSFKLVEEARMLQEALSATAKVTLAKT
jgi:tetratricopeptide (TPR) repeat protein